MQALVFTNRDLGPSLHVGDISVAVGWSGDLAPWAARSSNIVLMAPAGGVHTAGTWHMSITGLVPVADMA